MILQALHQLAQQEDLMADPDYEPKPVAWLVRVAPGGKFLGIQGTHTVPPVPERGRQRSRPEPKKIPVPFQPGRSGTKAPPQFLVDNALYVFGLGTRDKPVDPENGKEKSGWFRESVRACADATGDDGVKAVLAFLEAVAKGETAISLPAECASNDQFAFVFAPDVDTVLTDREAIRRYWRHLRSGKPTDGASRQCLVTGSFFADEVGNFPQLKHVPGKNTAKGIALVSFNKAAFESLGWKGNDNAAISSQAAETCARALNRLLDPAYSDPHQPGHTLPRRNLRLSADTVVCYWAAERSAAEFCSVFAGLLEGNPDEVNELYRSVWRGKEHLIEDPSAFYTLTLTDTQGRAIVRGWFESTVREVADNLARHFADLDIVRNTRPGEGKSLPPVLPLRLILEALADPVEKRQEGIPSNHAAELMRAGLEGIPYPLWAVQRALERFRAEIGNENDDKKGWMTRNYNDARAAVIKAVLNRRRRFNPHTTPYPEVRRHMDPNNGNPGYVLGSLMAVMEDMQRLAMARVLPDGRVENVNASVVDRYFSGASASPRSVFVRLLKNTRHHARKAKDASEKAGRAFLLERLLDEDASRFNPKGNGFPAHLSLEDQGLFVLGYHQMRKWLWMNKEEREQWQKDHPDAPRAYLWSK